MSSLTDASRARPWKRTMIWGLSKPAAKCRPATRPELRCAECKFMFPRLAIGGCRYVRGLIHPSDFCDEFVPGRGKEILPGTLIYRHDVARHHMVPPVKFRLMPDV